MVKVTLWCCSCPQLASVDLQSQGRLERERPQDFHHRPELPDRPDADGCPAVPERVCCRCAQARGSREGQQFARTVRLLAPSSVHEQKDRDHV